MNRSLSLSTALCLLLVPLALSPSQAGAQSRWQNDAPGRTHRIDVAALPAPFATPSARDFPAHRGEARRCLVEAAAGIQGRRFHARHRRAARDARRSERRHLRRRDAARSHQGAEALRGRRERRELDDVCERIDAAVRHAVLPGRRDAAVAVRGRGKSRRALSATTRATAKRRASRKSS